MEAKEAAASQLAGLLEAVANLGKHPRGLGGEAAARQLPLALAKAVEDGLMHYYLERMGYTEPEELYDDPYYGTGVFRRVQSWEKANVIELFRNALGFDLESNELFCKVQEFFLWLGAGRGSERIKGEPLYAFLPERPMEDHIANSAAFFALLP
jgi:hypothetical protein